MIRSLCLILLSDDCTYHVRELVWPCSQPSHDLCVCVCEILTSILVLATPTVSFKKCLVNWHLFIFRYEQSGTRGLIRIHWDHTQVTSWLFTFMAYMVILTSKDFASPIIFRPKHLLTEPLLLTWKTNEESACIACHKISNHNVDTGNQMKS